MYTDYNDDKEENYYADDDKGNRGFDNEKIKRIVFFVLVFVVLVLLILVVAKGCSKSNKGTAINTNNNKPTVVISQTNVSLSVGESFSVEADVIEREGASIIWYSQNSNIASIDEGYIRGVNEGETSIVAVYKDKDGEIYESKCDVIVTSTNSKIEEISLGQDEMTMKLHDTVLLGVSTLPSDAKSSSLVYESEAPEIVSIDEKGYMTANSVGTTAIIVKTEDESVSSSIIVKVSETGKTEIYPTEITIDKLENGLTVGGTSYILYSIKPDNATNDTVTWTSSDPSVATVEKAVITAHKAGTCTIIATTENGLSSKIDVVVESNSIPVNSVIINGDTAITIPLGGTRLLSYTIEPSNATNKNVKYTVENSNVIFMDSNGLIAGIGVGTSVVTVTTEDGSKTALVNVTVTDSTKSIGEPDDTSVPESGDTPANDDSSSGDASGSGSSDESYTVSGGGSSSSGGGSSNLSTSCGTNSIDVSSNQYSDGARTSTSGWDTAKNNPFKKKSPVPGMVVNTYDSCIKSATYKMWYGKSETISTNSTPLKKGTFPKSGTLVFGSNSGYYYVEVSINTNDNLTFTKRYYAVVDNGNSNVITVSKTATSNGSKFVVKNISSETIRVAACTTKSISTSDKCNPQLSNSSCGSSYCQIPSYQTIQKNGSRTYDMTYNTTSSPTKSSGGKICFKAFNSSGNAVTSTDCYTVQKNSSSGTKSSTSSTTTTPQYVDWNKKIVTINNRQAISVSMRFKDSSNLTILACTSTTSSTAAASCNSYKSSYVTQTKSGNVYTAKYNVYIDKLKSGQKIYTCFFASNSYNKSKSKCVLAYTKS